MLAMIEHQIRDGAALESALRTNGYLLLKHSQRCGVSRSAFAAYAAFIAAHPDVPHGWIEVRESRPLSDRVTAASGLPHSSPQAIWFEDGTPRWHATHFDITTEALAAATAAS